MSSAGTSAASSARDHRPDIPGRRRGRRCPGNATAIRRSSRPWAERTLRARRRPCPRRCSSRWSCPRPPRRPPPPSCSSRAATSSSARRAVPPTSCASCPGFVISQHQGGGKAEQYFLRGLRRRPRHGHRALRRRAARQPPLARPRPGLRRPPLPDPGDPQAGGRLQGAVLRRVRRLRDGRRHQLHHARYRAREPRRGGGRHAGAPSAT